MFKKLHSFNESSMNSIHMKKKDDITYRNNFVKNNSDHKRNNSYGEKFRKKNHLIPQIPQLEIIQTQSFLFQGRLASVIQHSTFAANQREKHGEGVMFLKNGTLIIGIWDHGYLNGRALIFTPFGGKTIAQFYNGKLNGWAITSFAQKLVVIAAYYQNKIDGQKIIYEANEMMWVGSKYVKQTNSYKIIHLEKGQINSLPGFLKFSLVNDLFEVFSDFINQESCCLTLKQIKSVPITTNLTFIGYCNEQQHPNGLGAIYGKNQFYFGYFREGSLQCYGRMIFQNGQIYHGELLNGVFYGQGVYYNPLKNMSAIMSSTREQQKVLDQQEGYICIDSNLNYFKYSKHSQSGMIGDPLSSIQEVIEKYYSRYFIEKKSTVPDNCSDQSQFGVSQNNQDIDSSLCKIDPAQNKKQKQAQKKKKQTLDTKQKWLNFNANNQSANVEQSSFAQSANNQSELHLQRVYSLDKRQAAHHRKHLAQQSIPSNFEEFHRGSNINEANLEYEINKMRLDRNFSLRQKKLQNKGTLKPVESIKVKENIHPQQLDQIRKKNTVPDGDMKLSFNKNLQIQNNKNLKNSSLDVLTFRDQRGIQDSLQASDLRNQRKDSHMIESGVNYSPQESVISNLSQKVQGLVKKDSNKRKKIFI